MEKLKNIGDTLKGLAIFICLIVLVIVFLKGAVWISTTILPWISAVNAIGIVIGVVILVPLTLIKPTRVVGAFGLYIASYLYGATLWVWGCVITYVLWGLTGLVVGLVILGVGVVPIAIIACLFNGMWSLAIQLIVLFAITFGARMLAAYMIERVEETSSDLVQPSSEPTKLAPELTKPLPELVRTDKKVTATIEKEPLRYAVDGDRLIDCFTMREWFGNEKAWYEIPDRHVFDCSIKLGLNMVTTKEAAIRFSGAINNEGEEAVPAFAREGDCFPPYTVNYRDHKNNYNTISTKVFENRATAIIYAQQVTIESFKERGGIAAWLGNGCSGAIYNAKGEYVYDGAAMEEAVRLFKTHHLV